MAYFYNDIQFERVKIFYEGYIRMPLHRKLFWVLPLSMLGGFILLGVYVKYFKANGTSYRVSEDSSLNMLSDNHFTICASYNGFYEFDPILNKWKLLYPNIYGSRPQEVTMAGDAFYYFDIVSNSINRIHIGGINAQTIVGIKLDDIVLSVSRSGNNLAFFSCNKDGRNDLHVYDIEHNRDSVVYTGDVSLIVWSFDENSRYLETEESVCRLSLIDGGKYQMGHVMNGRMIRNAGPYYLSFLTDQLDGTIICYRLNLLTENIQEVARFNNKILGYEWDNMGRYVVFGEVVKTGLLAWGPQPVILDTLTGKSCHLPPFPYYTGCIFLKNMNNSK